MRHVQDSAMVKTFFVPFSRTPSRLDRGTPHAYDA
jgi:hypothetical protein